MTDIFVTQLYKCSLKCLFFFFFFVFFFVYDSFLNFRHLEIKTLNKMPHQLPTDCLNEIFVHLDLVSLRSCLLVNHLWCDVSVPILWTSIQNYDTLIACLPNESKEILYKNEIIISIPKPPLFNYVTFIKSLTLYDIDVPIISQGLNNNKNIIVAREIFKMLMSQTTFKKLNLFHVSSNSYLSNTSVPFTTYPGAVDCLRNLSELVCYSDSH